VALLDLSSHLLFVARTGVQGVPVRFRRAILVRRSVNTILDRFSGYH
jgi:hypothetical protein